MTSSTLKLLLLMLIGCCSVHSDAALSASSPRQAPSDAEMLVFPNETIDFKNVTGITNDDMNAMFAIQKEWLESYFRAQQRRHRGLQTMRDSRDIVTEFEFVRQTAITGTDGRPGTQVSYIQKIGFASSGHAGGSARKLVQVDADNINAVYALVIGAYFDQTSLSTLSRTLRQNVGSFSTLYGITKRYEFTPDTAPLPVIPAPAPVAPAPTPATSPSSPSTTTETVFENETIDFKNVASISAQDVDAMFALKKEWFEGYFRQQARRRGLQASRRRDSRDITTQYTFVSQTVATGADGKPTTKVTYTQTIGFLPSSTRKLAEVDENDPDAIYALIVGIYQNTPVLTELALSLRQQVASFSTLEGISKVFDHMMMMSPAEPAVPLPAPTTMPPPPTPIMARPPAPETTTSPPPPTTAPPPPSPAAETPSPDVEIVFNSETIDFINAESATPQDIDAMFALTKTWFESYYRNQSYRRQRQLLLRGLQTGNQRRRDSRDITTQFTFVQQQSVTTQNGKPVNRVTYNQVIGFAPTTTTRSRSLFEVNVDDSEAVYALVMNIFKDEAALQDLARTLRMNVDSFSMLEGISKIFNHML